MADKKAHAKRTALKANRHSDEEQGPELKTKKKVNVIGDYHSWAQCVGNPTNFAAGAVLPPTAVVSLSGAPTSAAPPQGNTPSMAPTHQPYGVLPGISTAPPYMVPGQQLYAQGPPPTYDQALTHPAIVGQPVYQPSATMYAAGYPTYLSYPTYAPMQYYPSIGAYSYPVQHAQLRPTIMIPNGYDAGARFDGLGQPVIPPAPPGVPPNAAQLAAMAGHPVAISQKKGSFLTGSSDGGYTFW